MLCFIQPKINELFITSCLWTHCGKHQKRMHFADTVVDTAVQLAGVIYLWEQKSDGSCSVFHRVAMVGLLRKLNTFLFLGWTKLASVPSVSFVFVKTSLLEDHMVRASHSQEYLEMLNTASSVKDFMLNVKTMYRNRPFAIMGDLTPVLAFIDNSQETPNWRFYLFVAVIEFHWRMRPKNTRISIAAIIFHCIRI